MQIVRVPIVAYGNRKIETQKLAIHAEKDKEGKVFYKAEAQDVGKQAAVSFHYNLEDAIKEFQNIVRELLTKQTKELEKGEQSWH